MIQNFSKGKQNQQQQRSRRKGRNTKPYSLTRQLGKNIDIFNKLNGATVNINLPITIFTNATSGFYTFTSGSDIRFLSFNSITSTASTADFGKYAAIFQEYRIKSASVIVSRVTNAIAVSIVEALPSLYLGCDPEVVSVSNPTNLNLLESDSAKFIPSTILDAKSINFTFPGVGNQTNLWVNTNLTTSGGYYIGNNPTSTVMPATILIAFDCIFAVVCEFRGSLTH